jgi:hypothetical protein
MQIDPVGTELIHVVRQTDGWTYMPKLKGAFRNFRKPPLKKGPLMQFKYALKCECGNDNA